MIEKILDYIKNQNITVGQWILGFLGIFSIRLLLESFSNAPSSGIAPSDPYTIIHYGLFFLSLTLGIIFILGYFTKDYKNTPKLILFGLPIIWLAPILDLILSFGKGFKMTYLLDTHSVLIYDFFTFSGDSPTYGSTYGIRIEIAIILLGLGYYVWLQKKDWVKSLLVMLVTYTLIFFVAIVPGLLYTISHLNETVGTQPMVINYLNETMLQSNILHNTLREGTLSVSQIRFFELAFNKLLSQILFIISCLFVTAWFWKSYPEKFRVILKNLRLGRILFYLLLIGLGMSYAYLGGNHLNSWVDVLGILSLVLGWVGAWMYAVHTNDIEDVEIDRISNSERPLVQNKISVEEMKQIGFVWLLVALIGVWSAGFYPFFMVVVCLAISHIYSSPPLRFKQIPVLSSFLISLICLSTVLAGFFFVSFDKKLEAFPILLVAGIVVIFTLAINIKDMKDVVGDSAEGIKTLPVIFKKNGARVVGLCLSLSILLTPIFLSFYILYIIAIPVSIANYILVTKNPYREKPVIVLNLIFIMLVILLFLIAPLLLTIM